MSPVRWLGAALCRGCVVGSIPTGGSFGPSYYTSLARKLIVGEPTTADRSECFAESVGILVFALIEPECPLIEVSEQVVRLDADVRTLYPALQQAPEVPKAVGVNVSVNVLLCVVNNVVDVLGVNPPVGAKRVRVYL